jgi:hypothetical protein
MTERKKPMKNAVCVILCLSLLLLFLLPGCKKADDSPVGFEIVPGTVTSTGLTYRITPHEEGWTFGTDFSLERLDNDEWVSVPEIETDTPLIFNAVGISADPGQTKEMSAGWELLYGALEPGHYRICKGFLHKISSAIEKTTLYAEFDIPSP